MLSKRYRTVGGVLERVRDVKIGEDQARFLAFVAASDSVLGGGKFELPFKL